VLLSADLAPMADIGPSDYGPTLFQQSLLADSLLFDQDRYDHKPSSVSASGHKPSQKISSAVRDAKPVFVLQDSRPQTNPIQLNRDLTHAAKPMSPPPSIGATDSTSTPFEDLFGSLEDLYEEIDIPESNDESSGTDSTENTNDEPSEEGVDLAIDVSPTIFEANSGDWIDLSWTVTNIGVGDAGGNGWHDWVVYSQDQTPDDSDVYLSSQWSGSQGLDVGESYDVIRSAQLSDEITQDGYLIFFTDRWDRLEELDNVNNYTVVAFDLLDSQEDSGEDDASGDSSDDDSGGDSSGDDSGGEGESSGGDSEDDDSSGGDEDGEGDEDRIGGFINSIISED
jgi:hypothetical protein